MKKEKLYFDVNNTIINWYQINILKRFDIYLKSNAYTFTRERLKFEYIYWNKMYLHICFIFLSIQSLYI